MYFWYFLYKQKVHNENKVRKKNINLSFYMVYNAYAYYLTSANASIESKIKEAENSRENSKHSYICCCPQNLYNYKLYGQLLFFTFLFCCFRNNICKNLCMNKYHIWVFLQYIHPVRTELFYDRNPTKSAVE